LSVAYITVLVIVMLLYMLFNDIILQFLFNNLAVIKQIWCKSRTRFI